MVPAGRVSEGARFARFAAGGAIDFDLLPAAVVGTGARRRLGRPGRGGAGRRGICGGESLRRRLVVGADRPLSAAPTGWPAGAVLVTTRGLECGTACSTVFVATCGAALVTVVTLLWVTALWVAGRFVGMDGTGGGGAPWIESASPPTEPRRMKRRDIFTIWTKNWLGRSVRAPVW